MLHCSIIKLIVLIWLLLRYNVVECSFVVDNVKPTSSSSDIPEPTLSTLIDILSSNVEYSTFLRTIQRNGLIPLLNSLQNVTLLAPINLAFWDEGQIDKLNHDTLQRYVIDQKFRVGYLSKQLVILHSLYQLNNKSYPIEISPNFESLEYEVDHLAAIIETDIYAKHQYSFVQVIDELLPLKPTICDVLMDQDNHILEGHNISFIQGLLQLLFYNEYGMEKKHHKGIKHRKFPSNCNEFFNTTKSFFLPTDDYIFTSMPKMISDYYSALYPTIKNNNFSTTNEAKLEIKNDIYNLLQRLMIPDVIGPSNFTKDTYHSIDKKSNYHVSNGDSLDQIILNDAIHSSVNGSHVVLGDGTIHLFSHQDNDFFKSLNIPLIPLTPRKSLFAMHFSNFVKELEFRKLHYLIDGSTTNQTIFVSIDQKDDSSENDNMLTSSFSSKQSLLYQFTTEAIDILHNTFENQNTRLSKLLDTNMCSKPNIGGCYRLKLSSSYNDKTKSHESIINDEANIISPPIQVGSDSISYIVDGEISTPVSLKNALGELISTGKLHRDLEHVHIDRTECLKTIQYLSEFNLLSLPKNKKGYTSFLPCGVPIVDDDRWKKQGTWKDLGLVLNYLKQNPKVFEKILKSVFFEGVIYSDFGLNNSDEQLISSKSLSGDIVNITNESFDGDYNHIIKVGNHFLPIPLNSDLLLNQGVVHIVSDLLLPSDFSLTLKDLVKATGDVESLFLELIELIPNLSESLGLESSKYLNYSLLIPSPDSLAAFNVTENVPDIWSFLQLHVIPNKDRDKLLDCVLGNHVVNPLDSTMDNYLIEANNSQAVFSCRVNKNGKSVLEVFNKDNSDSKHHIKVLSHGCTLMGHQGSCVFMIDRPINVKWLNDGGDGFLHVHLGFVSVGVGIILGLVLLGTIVVALVFCLARKPNSKQLPPNNDVNNPFLNNNQPSIMDLRISDEGNLPYDRGYETDDDMYYERDRLLPKDVRHFKEGSKYGAISGNRSTGPRSIRGKQQSNNVLNRNRNLPGV